MNKVYDAFGTELNIGDTIAVAHMVIQKPEADFLRDVVAHGMDKQT